MQRHLDIVVPCYNEEDNIALFYSEVEKVFATSCIDCENLRHADEAVNTYDNRLCVSVTIYFVDDGSSDRTLCEIKKLADTHGEDKVKYISLSRNFGKEAAIYAGLCATNGDLVVLMDADLQHPPRLLPDMISAIDEGYDSCAAFRARRVGEKFFRSIFSKVFYWLFSLMSNIKVYQSVMDYRLMTRKMVDAVVSLGERERFTKGLFEWVGFKTKLIACPVAERAGGKSAWKMNGLFGYAIGGIVSFSVVPLRIATFFGMISAIGGVGYALFILIYFWVTGTAIGGGGGLTALTCILLIIGGLILLCIGIIGEYIARIYSEVKQRPVYLISDSNI